MQDLLSLELVSLLATELSPALPTSQQQASTVQYSTVQYSTVQYSLTSQQQAARFQRENLAAAVLGSAAGSRATSGHIT